MFKIRNYQTTDGKISVRNYGTHIAASIVDKERSTTEETDAVYMLNHSGFGIHEASEELLERGYELVEVGR